MKTKTKTDAHDEAEFSPAKRRARLTPGEAVAMLRELHSMTQNELAEASGVTQSTISAIEHGRASLGIDRAKKLARALKVHPAVLAFADWNEDSESGVRRSKGAKSVA